MEKGLDLVIDAYENAIEELMMEETGGEAGDDLVRMIDKADDLGIEEPEYIARLICKRYESRRSARGRRRAPRKK
ncbi:MAG: hypothetical protein MPJ08_05175 [Nitrosopumilus sp.]|nr:hypothetical protein [Nitrosopumilus sp.]